jgi:hypothetical protein
MIGALLAPNDIALYQMLSPTPHIEYYDAPFNLPSNDGFWHEPSVPATARVGPEVGVELPMVRAGH